MMYAASRPITVTTASQQLLPANSRRVHAVIQNIHAANTLWINLGFGAAASEGIQLNAGGGSYEITLFNPWPDEIWGIADGAGTTVLVTEVTT